MIKKGKKWWSVLSVLTVLVAATGFVACKQQKYTEGLEYTLSADGAYYIVSGMGTATDADVVIPSTYKYKPVKEIGRLAFGDCDSLTSIKIPDGVTSIDDYAFFDCDSLTSIVIPDNVQSVGYAAFYNCSALSSVTIGNGVESLGKSVFSSCDALETVIFKDTQGWYATEEENAGNGTDLILTNHATNARYLTYVSQYSGCYWYKN